MLPVKTGIASSEFELIGRQGAVKIIEQSEGVEIKWVLFSANWTSLYYLIDSLHLYTGPFTLRYFLSGWFTEKLATSEQAKVRIQQLMAKSDVHVSQHAFVKQKDPEKAVVPHILKDALNDMTAIPDFSVDCVLDEDTNQFLVRRVGPQSTLAQLYGMSPVSMPCLTGNTYDQVISAAYTDVVAHDKPCYDHVIAAMNFPDQTVTWLPYQRVILPHRFPDGRKGVSVVTAHTDVDIKVI